MDNALSQVTMHTVNYETQNDYLLPTTARNICHNERDVATIHCKTTASVRYYWFFSIQLKWSRWEHDDTEYPEIRLGYSGKNT